MLSAAVDFVLEETMSEDAKSLAKAPLIPPVAYQSDRFMESADARTIRIAAEYIEPQLRLKRAGIQNTVVFFGSARISSRQEALRRMSELDIRGSNGAGAPTGWSDNVITKDGQTLRLTYGTVGGTTPPASIDTMSPGTSCSAGIWTSSPPRCTPALMIIIF